MREQIVEKLQKKLALQDDPIKEFNEKVVSEEEDEEEGESEEEISPKYKKVQDILKNDLFNHAAIIDRMSDWGDKSSATDRSLFRKRLHREKGEDGGIHEFSDDELSEIMSILRKAANEISGTKKKSKKKTAQD